MHRIQISNQKSKILFTVIFLCGDRDKIARMQDKFIYSLYSYDDWRQYDRKKYRVSLIALELFQVVVCVCLYCGMIP